MDTDIAYTAEEQAANRAALVTALRSGDYAQGQHALQSYVPGESRQKPRFCCLGVACDISGLGVWDNEGGYVATDGTSSTTHLPGIVQRWLGFRTDNGALEETISTPVDCSSVLTDANDDGVTFEEIADLIEGGKVQTI